MMKNLLKTFFAFTISGMAVNVSAQSLVNTDVAVKRTLPANSISSKLNVNPASTASCGADTIIYPYLKELVFAGTNDSFFIDAMVGNVRTASQAYHLSGSANVLGVQFWGGAYSTNPNFVQVLPVKVLLYTVDAQNMPVTAIDSAIVNIGTGYDFYEALFTTPQPVGTNFAVGVKNTLNDTVAVITNNSDNVWTSTNYGESLAWRRFGSGAWNSTLSFFGQDLEYMIFPIVSYDITSNYSMTDDSTCVGTANTFTNTSSPILSDRMFNLYAFDEYWGFAASDSSYEWNYGDSPAWTNSVNGSHTYTAPGMYDVKLAAEMLGYYTTCNDTMTMALEVMPQVTAGFTYDATLEPTISFMESAAGESTYLWDFGDGNTSMAQNPTHTYAANGTYTVTQTVTGYCGSNTTTQTIMITTVGVNEVQGLDVNAFYNAEANLLNVSMSASSNATIEVYNIVGELVYTESGVSASTKAINLNGLSAGTYVVRVKTANSFGAAKFAVIK